MLMKKRFLSMLVLLAAVATGAWAQTQWTSGDCTVTLNNGTMTVSGKGAMADLVSEQQPWDNYKNDITSVVVESGVTAIGTGVFDSFKNMTSVTLPEGLTSIGNHAFYSCSSLTSITIPSTVTSIGIDTFWGCEGMTDVYLYADPANLTWAEDACDDFKYFPQGSTQCHVLAEHLSAYETKFTGVVNVTFVGDLEPLTPTTYAITLAEGTEDFDKWTIEPTEAAAGSPVTATYNGSKKVKSVKAVKKAAGNTYLKWDADQKKLVATDIPAGATPMTSSTTAWAGTYVVEGDVTISGQIKLNGNVDLIIKDGAKLTAKQIYGNSSKYNLSIYGQANKTGQLVVNSSNDEDAIAGITTLEVHSAKVTATSSSGGCSGFYEISTFNVYGGSVDGENTGSDGYGILLKNNGSMNIYGGDVKAVGKGTSSYGIWSSSATVTVYGGKLWAENADKKAIDFGNVTLTKDTGYTSGKIEYSSDKSTWSETKDTSAKYVRVGY